MLSLHTTGIDCNSYIRLLCYAELREVCALSIQCNYLAYIRHEFIGQCVEIEPLHVVTLLWFANMRITLPSVGSEKEIDVRLIFNVVHYMDKFEVGSLDGY